MKCSELISKLTESVKNHGDLDVMVPSSADGWSYAEPDFVKFEPEGDLENNIKGPCLIINFNESL